MVGGAILSQQELDQKMNQLGLRDAENWVCYALLPRPMVN